MVEDIIYEQEEHQREIMMFLHNLFINEYGLTAKVTFNNPCYYKNSWICYTKAINDSRVELAFLRGNELSDEHKILKSNGRKQLRSIEISGIQEIPITTLKTILHEALLLDETTPYASKRKTKKK